MVAGRLTMVAPGVGEAAEGSGVARDCSGELRSGRACGGVGASRSAGGERVREGGEELRGVASQLEVWDDGELCHVRGARGGVRA